MQCNLRAFQISLQFTYIWFGVYIPAVILVVKVIANSLSSRCPKASGHYITVAITMGTYNSSKLSYQIMLSPQCRSTIFIIVATVVVVVVVVVVAAAAAVSVVVDSVAAAAAAAAAALVDAPRKEVVLGCSTPCSPVHKTCCLSAGSVLS